MSGPLQGTSTWSSRCQWCNHPATPMESTLVYATTLYRTVLWRCPGWTAVLYCTQHAQRALCWPREAFKKFCQMTPRWNSGRSCKYKGWPTQLSPSTWFDLGGQALRRHSCLCDSPHLDKQMTSLTDRFYHVYDIIQHIILYKLKNSDHSSS